MARSPTFDFGNTGRSDSIVQNDTLKIPSLIWLKVLDVGGGTIY